VAESPPRYRFTGLVTTGFFSYADLGTGSMLIAEPGKSYAMRATGEGLPVPPSGSQWEADPAAVDDVKAAAGKAGKAARPGAESIPGGES
jgi:hypothetical protein